LWKPQRLIVTNYDHNLEL